MKMHGPAGRRDRDDARTSNAFSLTDSGATAPPPTIRSSPAASGTTPILPTPAGAAPRSRLVDWSTFTGYIRRSNESGGSAVPMKFAIVDPSRPGSRPTPPRWRNSPDMLRACGFESIVVIEHTVLMAEYTRLPL